MAARKSSSDLDDAVETTDGDELDDDLEVELESEDFVEEELEETSLEEAFEDEDDLDADDLDGDELPDDTDEDPTELTATPTVDDEGEGDDVVPPPDASFDDEDDEGLVAAVAGEDDDHEVEGLRDGEFVCRSCYIAKRDTQLADPERLLCRDCA